MKIFILKDCQKVFYPNLLLSQQLDCLAISSGIAAGTRSWASWLFQILEAFKARGAVSSLDSLLECYTALVVKKLSPLCPV